jgi:hypothetical protein
MILWLASKGWGSHGSYPGFGKISVGDFAKKHSTILGSEKVKVTDPK